MIIMMMIIEESAISLDIRKPPFVSVRGLNMLQKCDMQTVIFTNDNQMSDNLRLMRNTGLT